MNRLITIPFAATLLGPATTQKELLAGFALKTFEILKTIVEVDTSKANAPASIRPSGACSCTSTT